MEPLIYSRVRSPKCDANTQPNATQMREAM